MESRRPREGGGPAVGAGGSAHPVPPVPWAGLPPTPFPASPAGQPGPYTLNPAGLPVQLPLLLNCGQAHMPSPAWAWFHAGYGRCSCPPLHSVASPRLTAHCPGR